MLFPFDTVAEAITAAAALTGDTTIFAMPGTYTETVTVASGDTLIGFNAAGLTVTGNFVQFNDDDINTTGTITAAGAATQPTLNLTASSNQIVFDSDQVGGFTGTLSWTPTTSAKTWTLQDFTGTLYGTTGLDVTLADGGTNSSLTADVGAIPYSTTTNLSLLAATATADQLLMSGSNAAPAWSTSVYLDTMTANAILFASAANTMAEITPAASSVLVTSGANVPSLATDIPTAITIGSGYIYRAGGTDVPDGDVADDLTISGGTVNNTIIGGATDRKSVV